MMLASRAPHRRAPSARPARHHHGWARTGSLAIAGLCAVLGGACGRTKPDTLPAESSGGQGGPGGASSGAPGGARSPGSGGGGGGAFVPLNRSCDDIGSEPQIPAACATVLATKTITGGIPTDESTLDTMAIQRAIDACPNGQAVRLAPDGDNAALVSGALFLKNGVTLWIDAGVTLFASRNPRDFDAVAGRCGGNNTGSSSCYALINARAVIGAGLMGLGTIDGRGGEVVADAAATTPATWWELEDAYDGNLVAPRLLQVNGGANFTLYQITMHNAAKFHVVIDSTNGFVVWGITIVTPPSSPNTDGVDPAGAKNGVIAYNKISTGDDNIAIKGSGPVVDNLLISHNHFGRGHGMSIGSETYGGVQNVTVCDLSLDGTQNGLRIKSDASRGGLVRAINYSDVCMRNVRNPLIFDPYYSSATGNQIPNYQDIHVKNVHVLGGGSNRLRGYDAAHPLIITLDNVVFDGAPTVTASDAQIAVGPDAVTLSATGTNVMVTGEATGTATARACDDAWVTF